ncbi:MAG: hypothetical protein KF857_11490 [Fimbriimonadaceae bacterium]|nr:hypothetical protein [Fimbriimonadaceae bacterium]
MAAATQLTDLTPARRRLPVRHVLAATFFVVFFLAQLAIGTDVTFAFLVMLYGAFAWTTIHLLGGPFSIGGFIISVCATIHVGLGQVIKTVIMEAPDKDLLAPVPTMLACVIGMAGFMAAAVLLRFFKYESWRSILPPRLDSKRLRMIGLLTLSASTVAIVFLLAMPVTRYFQSGGTYGFARTVSNAALIGMSLLAAASILDKKRIFSPLLVAALVLEFLFATVNASRQNFIGPVLIIGLTALLFRHKFRLGEVLVFAVLLVFYQTTFSPFALYGRSEFREGRLEERLPKAMSLLGRFMTDKSLYVSKKDREAAKRLYSTRRLYYYRGLPDNRTLDRLTLLPVIDSLIASNLDKEPLGAETTIWGFRLATPSIFNRDKPLVSTTNFLAHKGTGLVNYGDYGTQISMGFTADALISYGWSGIFFVSMILALVMISVYRTIFGHTLMFNAAALGIMFQATMTFTEGSIATITSQILGFAPLVCIAFVTLLWMSNALVKRRNPELTMVKPITSA